MSYLVNVALLLKDELVFEIRVRGSVPEGDVISLRRQLRDLVATGAAVEWPVGLDPGGELSVCRTKCEEWEGGLEDLVSEVPSGRERARMLARLGHLVARLRLINLAPGLEASARAWIVESLSSLDLFLARLAEASTPQPSVTQQQPVFPTGRPEVVREDLPTEFSAAEVRLGESGYGVCAAGAVSAGLPPPAPVQQVAYMKLPNPISPLLQSLPRADGMDPEVLMTFLGVFLRLSDLPDVAGGDLLRLVLPACRGPLADLLLATLAGEATTAAFHRDVVEAFLPGRLRSKLIMDRVYRPQKIGERLAEYISSVREARRSLRLAVSERETVDLILEGLAPEERSRLVFCARPSTFLDLQRLCIASRSVQYVDQVRGGTERRRVMAVEQTPRREEVGPGRRVCFECGQPGHFRRECPRGRGRGSGNSGRGGLPPQ